MAQTPPVLSTNCYFSNGCASFSGGGLQMKNLIIDSIAGVSVCTWYLVTPPPQFWQRIFDFGQGSGLNNILLARLATTDTLVIDVYRGTTKILMDLPIGTNEFAPNMQWTHVCMTQGSSFIWQAYINGQPVLNYTASDQIENILFYSNLIGASNWLTDPPFTGMMDEFRVYTRELSPAEIATLYAWRGGAGACYPCAAGTAECSALICGCDSATLYRPAHRSAPMEFPACSAISALDNEAQL